ncbi:hypothetical protein FA13DRAFT_1717047 [Coprinellus micaceus]|uniref:Uncharacterized protein n=1 Tax=Coprinellus micaceus TaxID=71717 RepID=A0A4Y7SJ94_COPMI|nr:hypothetical protein FA13DRAFT_1717047 [Coprinellus micaceus]
MPKDVNPDSRRSRASLRELAHIRRHALSSRLRRDEDDMQCDVTSSSIDTPVDTSELATHLSALSLDTLEECRGSHFSTYQGRMDPTAEWGCSGGAVALPGGSARLGGCADVMTGIHSTALDQALKANASLRRRVQMLERREGTLKSELRVQKRTVESMETEAAGARRLVEIAEERARELEARIEKLNDESFRYCRWWLSEYRSVHDLLAFVADPNDRDVHRIASSSRARFLEFSSVEFPGAMARAP